MFLDDEMAEITKPGMATGLAWTSAGRRGSHHRGGGERGEGGLQAHGKARRGHAGIGEHRLLLRAPHLRGAQGEHAISGRRTSSTCTCPAGATPKDGPSAGITLASALLSLATGKKLKKALAMTGELSLVGRVLPIGGLKEKVIAARRNRIKQVIFPAANQRDLEEIPDHVREGITFHPSPRWKRSSKNILSGGPRGPH